MKQAASPDPGRMTAKQFNTAAMAASGLYLATHSVAVTAIGTSAWAVMACWSMWLERAQRRDSKKPGTSSSE